MTDRPVAAEPTPKAYPRRTRVPDWMTDVVLVVNAYLECGPSRSSS